LDGILRGLTENRAETDPASPDRRLTGRTYAIPFEDVWQAAKRLASGELPGWSLWVADDQAGRIEASRSKLLFLPAADILVRIGLDDNAQTRVDVSSTSRTERGDLGRSRRTIGTFLRRLDDALDVRPGQILDPTRAQAWQDLP
jgi:hypothetical protein